VTWSLEAAGTADQAFLCVNSQHRDASGAPSGVSEKDCYRIDPAGQRLGMRVTLVVPGVGTFVFQ
jgi:hypothetical protein